MYFPSSENKGAEQLCSHAKASLRLCFRLGKNPVFSYDLFKLQKLKSVTGNQISAGWIVS